jgi:transcriptional regulator with XRE-family HTH domain
MKAKKNGEKEMSATVTFTKQQLSRNRYTPEGIERLSMVIRATLSYNGLSERELAGLASIPHQKLNKYVLGKIRKPTRDILDALAPHLLRVHFVSEDKISIDPKHTYGDDWRSLDQIAMADYDCGLAPSLRRRSTDTDLN